MSKACVEERTASREPPRPIHNSDSGNSGPNLNSIRALLYSGIHLNRRNLTCVQVRPLDERIRQLCAEAAKADDTEVPEILAELQSLLREHNEFVRKMVSQTLNCAPKKHSSGSKTAA